MKATVTPEAANAVSDIAQRHGLSREAVLAMLFAAAHRRRQHGPVRHPRTRRLWAMDAGRDDDGRQHVRQRAQGARRCAVQRVGAVARHHHRVSRVGRERAGRFTSGNWWPADLGVPSSAGGQNDARYAVFPSTRRLAIQINGATRVFDTGEHQIGGVQQQQGGGYGTVSFTSQLGTFDVSSLRELGARQVAETPASAPVAPARLAVPVAASVPSGPPRPACGAADADAATCPRRIIRGPGRHRRGHRVAGRTARARHPVRRGVRREEDRTARPALEASRGLSRIARLLLSPFRTASSPGGSPPRAWSPHPRRAATRSLGRPRRQRRRRRRYQPKPAADRGWWPRPPAR